MTFDSIALIVDCGYERAGDGRLSIKSRLDLFYVTGDYLIDLLLEMDCGCT